MTSPETPTPNDAPPDDGRLGRLGRFCARHHWWIIGAWVIALIAIGLTGQSLGGQADDTVSLPGVRSAEGLSIIQEAYPGQGASQGIVVVYSPTTPVTSPSAKAAIALGSVRLKKVPGVLSVTGPQISPDQHIAQFVVQWSTPPQDLGTANLDALQDASAPLRAAGLTVEFGGSPAMQAEADAPDYSVLVGVLAATSRKAELLRLGNVMHLRTPIEGTMPIDRRFLEVAGELHPTPAVGGKPRVLALPFIPGFEPHQRGLYTGAVGWISSDGGSGKLFVALRCARLKGSEARAFAGAGIVAGSDPGAETAETEMKLRTVLEALT